MTNEEIFDFIIKVEAEFIKQGVTKEYLVLSRIFCFFHLRNPFGHPRNNNQSFGTKISLLLFSAIDFIKFLFSKEDCLLVGPAGHRNINIDGKLYSKHLDPLHYFLTSNGEKIIGLEIGLPKSCARTRSGFLNLTPLVRLLSKFCLISKEQNKIIDEFSFVFGEFHHDFFGGVSDTLVDKYKAFIIDYEQRRKFYQIFLKFKKIKRSYFVAYYDLDMLAMISCLRKQDIPVYEYQHGVQNNYHPMYCFLRNLYVNSPMTMPTHFLVWDDVSKNRFLRNDIVHLGIGVTKLGRLWDSYYKYKANNEVKKNVQKLVHGYKKVILLALQGFPYYFNFQVFDALKILNEDYLVLVREHPLHRLTSEQISTYFCQELFTAKIDLVANQEFGLDDLLSVVNICITGFSTVGLEANMAGAVTIFTHANAKDGLKEYIDSETIFYSGESSEILKLLSFN